MTRAPSAPARDLARINTVMRQSAIMADALAGAPTPGMLADLGGGDGRFLLGVARRLAKRWPGVRAVILDQHDFVSRETRDGFAGSGWHCEVLRGDIFELLPRFQPDIVTANLFLHHLDEMALTRLLAGIAARARTFVACEPRRGRFALWARGWWEFLAPMTSPAMTRVVSVRAGFQGRDFSRCGRRRALAPAKIRVLPFTHVFRAHAL